MSQIFTALTRPIRNWYSEINGATLTGAIDVIVVEQPDGSYLSSPFHVRFGKLGVLKAREKIVYLEVNDEAVDICMKLDEDGVAHFVESTRWDRVKEMMTMEIKKLDEQGAAYFVEGSDGDPEGEGDPVPPELATSPIPEHGFPPDFIKSTQDKTAAAASSGGSQVISIEDIEEDAREVSEDLASATATTSQNDTLLPPPPPTETSTPGPSQHGAQQQQSNRKMSSAKKKRLKRKGHNRTGSKSSVKDIFAGGSAGQDIFAMDEDEETNQLTPSATPVTPPGRGGSLMLPPLAPPGKIILSKSASNTPASGNITVQKTRHSSGEVSGRFVMPLAPPGPFAADVEAGHRPELPTTLSGMDLISSALLSSSCSKLLDEGQSGTTAGTTPGGNNGKLPRQNSVKDSFFLSRLPEAEKLDEIMKIEEAENSKKSPGEESSGNSATLSRKGSCAVGAAITVQYFSEPEMSPVTSPIGSRPGSPILSDTEFESAKRVEESTLSAAVAGDLHEQSWEWGKMPTNSPPTPTASNNKKMPAGVPADCSADPGSLDPVGGTLEKAVAGGKDSAAKDDAKSGSKSGGWFWFGGGGAKDNNNSKEDTKDESKVPEAVYLDDLKDNEQLMKKFIGAPMYNKNLSQKAVADPIQVPSVTVDVDEDNESGNGPSLSPRSVEGVLLPSALNSGAGAAASTTVTPVKHRLYEHMQTTNYRQTCYYQFDIDFSLCGGLDNPSQFSRSLFESGKLSFDDFTERLKVKNLDIFSNPNLVVRIGDQFFKWEAACPIIMSRVLFGRSLPSELVDVIAASVTVPVEAPLDSNPTPSSATSGPIASAEGANSADVIDTTPTKPSAAEAIDIEGVEKRNDVDPEPETSKRSSWFTFFGSKSGGESASTSPQKMGQPPNKGGGEDADLEAAGVPSLEKDPGSGLEDPSLATLRKVSECSTADEVMAEVAGHDAKRYKKTLRLSNDLIQKMNLKSGSNEVQFSVTTAFQGTTRCNCHVYLWKWTDKVVISDIDGTITKSDVLGHVLPIISMDWAQYGVASLFNKIRNNGYQIAYLSARAIGQAPTTKKYLESVSQEDLNLPDGPLLLNPTSLVNAFHREVIIKKPEEFKISCLEDIQRLFPNWHTDEGNPFYAGYGNRANDVVAYKAVKIPSTRIFTINPKGELRVALAQAYRASYSSQSEMVDHIFPPRSYGIKQLEPLNNYSSFAYWQEPLPSLDFEDEIRKMTEDQNPAK